MNEDKNQGVDIEEVKLQMIRDEFHDGIDSVDKINPSVTFYGSTRIEENNPNYEKVRKLSFRIAKELGYAVLSGGGPGIMEAANRGAFEAGGRSIGLTIKLPNEQINNPYLTEEIPFHFFFTRQSAMSYSTEVCVFCPGGFGTLSELFEIITLQQTNKIGRIPLILFGSDFWKPIDSTIKEVLLKKYHTVNEKDVELYIIKDDENEILEIIKNSRIRNGDDSLK
ncbi:MAG: TIGR00730 family Rossman fold protein [Candidatus Paceibacterota bacterium]